MSFDRREKLTGAKLFALGLKKPKKTENQGLTAEIFKINLLFFRIFLRICIYLQRILYFMYDLTLYPKPLS